MGQTTVVFDWTTVIAIYAAVLATGTLVWDWWKWKNAGPKLFVNAQVGMAMAGNGPISDERWMLMVATNRGDRATTITGFNIYQYPSWWSYVRDKPSYSGIVNTWNPQAGNETPYLLDPGKVWKGLAKQTDALVEMAKDSRLYLSVSHSHHPNPIRQRVRPEIVKKPMN